MRSVSSAADHLAHNTEGLGLIFSVGFKVFFHYITSQQSHGGNLLKFPILGINGG